MTEMLRLLTFIGLKQLFHRGADLLSEVVARYVDGLVILGRNKYWIDRALSGITEAFEIGRAKQAPEIF